MSSLIHLVGTIFQPLLKAVGWLLSTFYSVIPNYAIDTALLTIVLMALVTPLTVKATKSQVAMQAMAPEMKKLQAKYKGAENRMQLNEEMMALYREHGINPVSGCLPMLAQMPVFIILYDVIRGMVNTVQVTVITNGHKVVMTQAQPRYIGKSTKMYHDIKQANGKLPAFGFNFAERLLQHGLPFAHYIVLGGFVAVAIALSYLQISRLNARNPQALQANPQMAQMQKVMPLIFIIFYVGVPVLLNVYFVVSSAIRLGTQEVLFRRGIGVGAEAAKEARTAKRLRPGTATALQAPETGSRPAGPKRPEGGKPGPKQGRPAERPAKGTAPSPGAKGTKGAKPPQKALGGRSTPAEDADGGAAEKKPHPRSKDKRERRDR